MPKITFKNILSFVEGYSKFIYNEIVGLPEFYQEQIAYRMLKCKKDCLVTGKCKHCGCTADKKILVNASCNNGKRFPDMMNKETWEEYKKENNIKI